MNDDIVTQILSNTRSRFFLPRERFTGERAKYIELGIFVPTKLHYDYIDCPNGCGEDARVVATSSGAYVAVCNHQSITESIPIPADQVELYEFDQIAFDRAVKAGRITKYPEKIHEDGNAATEVQSTVLHDIQKTVHRIEQLNKNRAEQEKKKAARREGEDKCLEIWNRYLNGGYGNPVKSGRKPSFEDLFKKPTAKSELAKHHITTKKQVADAIRNARNRLNPKK